MLRKGHPTRLSLWRGIRRHAPCIAWLSLALISRISASARRPAALINPSWEHEPRRATIAFEAIEMTLRSLVGAIVVVVVVGGLGIAAVMITTGDAALLLGPRFLLILLGVLFGIPAFVVLVAFFRRRQCSYEVRFGMDRLEVSSPRNARTFRYVQIRELMWGGQGEYSRLRVITTTGERYEIIAGLAKLKRGYGALLPPLPRVVQTRLENAGLRKRASRRATTPAGPVIYRRPDPTHHLASDRGVST